MILSDDTQVMSKRFRILGAEMRFAIDHTLLLTISSTI